MFRKSDVSSPAENDGQPVWQKDYETFMKTIGFRTKLCKPRHPFTKGKVERLVRFVKENFLAGRTFWNVTDLNFAALEWCNEQNSIYHKATDGVPQESHFSQCIGNIRELKEDPSRCFYLCPERKISFDGFLNYNKESNFNIVFTSNRNPSLWRSNFNEDDALLCSLDRIFDDATVFNIKGESFRGKKLETIALHTSRVKAPDSSEEHTR